MRIVSIHAHPDDAEILAGGTLALLARGGHEVTIVTMTPGDCGSAEQGPEEIAAIRRNEAAAAAMILGAAYRCAEFRDLAIFSDDTSRRSVTELVRTLRPDIVLTSSPEDYLCDHEATSALVRDSLFAAPAPNYKTRAENPAPPLAAIPHLYFMDAVGGVGRDGRAISADFYADIAATFSAKKSALAQHASQRGWLLKQHGMDDYLETMEEWTRSCGARAGRTYAEGFRRYRGHPYPQTPLLEELLGQHVVIPAAETLETSPFSSRRI